MSSRDRAERFAGGRVKVENMWGKAPLLVIVDDSISHFAFRVGALFAVPTLQGEAIALSQKEIAECLSCSDRQVRRAIRELEARGYIEVSRKHNCRNSYTLVRRRGGVDVLAKPESQAVTDLDRETAGAPRAARRATPVACPQCRRIIKRLPRAGVCRTCSSEARVEKTARRVAREEIATARTA